MCRLLVLEWRWCSSALNPDGSRVYAAGGTHLRQWCPFPPPPGVERGSLIVAGPVMFNNLTTPQSQRHTFYYCPVYIKPTYVKSQREISLISACLPIGLCSSIFLLVYVILRKASHDALNWLHDLLCVTACLFPNRAQTRWSNRRDLALCSWGCRSTEHVHGDRKKLGSSGIHFLVQTVGWLPLRSKSLIVQFSLECY